MGDEKAGRQKRKEEGIQGSNNRKVSSEGGIEVEKNGGMQLGREAGREENRAKKSNQLFTYGRIKVK